MTFKDIFQGLSRTKVIHFPALSRSWNFQEKNSGFSKRRGNQNKFSSTMEDSSTVTLI